ncbi:MAG TPA: hypothetical protein VF960_10160 [Chloroflexota bacterium]
MADVFRGKSEAFSLKMIPGYAFHGVTAILTLVFLFNALSA